MKAQTFWILLMKIMGLFLLVDSITVIPQMVLTAYQTFGYDMQGSVAALAVLAFTALLYYLIMRYLILFPEKIVQSLKLNRSLDDMEINPAPLAESVYSVAAIVFGAYLFVDSLPGFCKALINYYQEEALSGRFGDAPSASWIVYHGVRMAAGYYILRYHYRIATFLKNTSAEKESLNTI